MKVLVTGSHGFIGSYICQDLLDNGYEVFGIDNFSKYGKVKKPFAIRFEYGIIRNEANFKSISSSLESGMIGSQTFPF